MTKDVTTEFIDETQQQEGDIAPTNLISDIYKSVHVEGTDTLKGFLEKPTLFYAGSLSTSDTVGTPLQTWTFPSEYMLHVKNANKLNGILAYRGDFEFTLKVNATRFMQGRYFMRIVYMGGSSTSVSVTKMCNSHVGNLTLATSGSHYDFDLATQISITFEVPYISVSNYSLVNYASVYSRPVFKLYLMAYDPLVAGSGDSTCQYAVWVRMKNITTTGNVVLQSAGSLELKKAKLGSISGIAMRVSKTASILGQIPLLLPVASTVGWMSSIVSQAAQVWGFSKPTIEVPPNPVIRKAIPFSANSDGVFTGQKLALSSTNEVPITTGRQRTQVDEMSFDFIKKQPAWVQTVAWPDTASSGTFLTSFNVSPQSSVVSLYKGFTLPPCDYLAIPFGYWRGTIKYRIIIPKTEFHSGRLGIAILPIEHAIAVAPTTIELTDNLARIIWDIRESNEIEFEVPFIQTRNFIEVSEPSAVVYIFVVNELIAPSTVSSQVNLLIEKSGGDSLEYASPVPTSTTVTYEPYVYFQSKLGMTFSPPTVEAESFGEVHRSIRSLMKRFSLYSNFYSNAAWGAIIDPFATVVTGQLTSTSGSLTRVNGAVDIISLFSPCYAISSGATRFAVSTGAINTNGAIFSLLPTNGTGTAVLNGIGGTDFMPNSPRVLVSTNVEGMATVEVPPYQPYGARSIYNRIPQVTGVFSSQPSDVLGGTNQLLAFSTTESHDYPANGVFFYRAAAEDFTLSVWNGTFPLVYNTTT